MIAVSIFIITVSVIKTSNGTDLIIGLSIGIVLLIASLAVLCKQITDFLLVTNHEIVFRNSLRRRRIPIGPDVKVKTLIERRREQSSSRPRGSYSWSVELFVKLDKRKYRILDFLMEDEDEKEAEVLSKIISKYIKKKIEESAAQ